MPTFGTVERLPENGDGDISIQLERGDCFRNRPNNRGRQRQDREWWLCSANLLSHGVGDSQARMSSEEVPNGPQTFVELSCPPSVAFLNGPDDFDTDLGTYATENAVPAITSGQQRFDTIPVGAGSKREPKRDGAAQTG